MALTESSFYVQLGSNSSSFMLHSHLYIDSRSGKNRGGNNMNTHRYVYIVHKHIVCRREREQWLRRHKSRNSQQKTYNFVKIMSSFCLSHSLHVLHFLMVLHTAWKKIYKFFGAGQTNGWGQFSVFLPPLSNAIFMHFWCAKLSIKRIHIILCHWCSATIKKFSSTISVSLAHSSCVYILFYDNELNFCRFSR